MKIDAEETRMNIAEKYGSVGEFAKAFGLPDSMLVYMAINGQRGHSNRVCKAKLILRRLRREGLLVELSEAAEG